jgi:ribosome biogenesis GTPase
MELTALGLDPWLQKQAKKLCEHGQEIARVTVVDRGQYMLRNAHGEVPAKATGKFMYSLQTTVDMPCVGDWVCMDYHDSKDFANIHAMLPRKSFLRRKSAGKNIKLQMIAANIDIAFIVQSCHYDFNVSRLERYLVMANEGHVEPLIILSKTDLVSTGELEQLFADIREVGINTRIIAISNVTGAGLEQIKEIMSPGNTYCIVGSSGVGKSTLINRLAGHNTLKTRTVSTSGEGRHTTVRRQLIVLQQGAMLIDTPGMREVGILDADEGMDENFDDIHELSRNCRFSDCNHNNEPECAILNAIENGKLQQEHYQNYVKIKTESEVNKKSYTNKRKKGSKPAKAAHSATKHKSEPPTK